MIGTIESLYMMFSRSFRIQSMAMRSSSVADSAGGNRKELSFGFLGSGGGSGGGGGGSGDDTISLRFWEMRKFLNFHLCPYIPGFMISFALLFAGFFCFVVELEERVFILAVVRNMVTIIDRPWPFPFSGKSYVTR